MIRCYRKTIKGLGVEEIDCPVTGSWIRAINPSLDELKELGKISKIPLDDLENSMDKNELPRIETINHSIFTIIRVPTRDQNANIGTEPLTIIITDSLIITIGLTITPFLDNILLDRDSFTTQKQKFLIKIFQKVSDEYHLHIKNINKSIQKKKVILSKLNNKDITDLVEAEETLNGFSSDLVLIINVFEKFIGGKHVAIFQNDKELIEDILVDTKQTLNFCETNLKIVNSLREAYSTILTNNLNSVIKFLTAITIVLTLPTIISSLYGMNINLPFQNHPLAFLIVFTITVVACILSSILFIKKRWM